jgi:hypothetical protein
MAARDVPCDGAAEGCGCIRMLSGKISWLDAVADCEVRGPAMRSGVLLSAGVQVPPRTRDDHGLTRSFAKLPGRASGKAAGQGHRGSARLESGLPTSGTRTDSAWRGRPESVTQRRAGACASNRASSSAQNSTQSGEMRGLREIPKRADRRLGIRQFSMAGRNIGAQIMRLCVEFWREWLAVHSAYSGRPWGAMAAAGLASRLACTRKPAVTMITVLARAVNSVTRDLRGDPKPPAKCDAKGHGDGNRDDRGDRGLPGDRDPTAAGSPDRLQHGQGVFTRHGRLHL